MRGAFPVVMLLIVSGCSGGSAARPSTGFRQPTSTSTAGSGAGVSKPSDNSVMNPDVLLATAPLGGHIADMSSAGASGSFSADGCEIGKFCAPSSPDPTDCGTLTLKQDVVVKRVPGTLLVVFDQSLSMSEPWGDAGMTKLQAAQTAIANAITTLQDSLTVGALFFPTVACVGAGGLGGLGGLIPGLPGAPAGMPGAMGAATVSVNPIEGDGQIVFQPAPDFLTAWTAHWMRPEAGTGIGTPMQEAFDRADQAITGSMIKGGLAVVAVTDGAPNCFPAGMDTALETKHAADWLAASGIKTYVVGLPGADGVQLLNDVAMSGGTMQYLIPEDPKTLEDKLKEVVQETIMNQFESCSIKLSPAANPPDKLLLRVVEAKDGKESRVDHMLGPNAGWTIAPDGTQADLTGQLCEDAKVGRFSKITFEYGCPDTPPPPPLDPPPLN
jgi:hypothetical protein